MPEGNAYPFGHYPFDGYGKTVSVCCNLCIVDHNVGDETESGRFFCDGFDLPEFKFPDIADQEKACAFRKIELGKCSDYDADVADNHPRATDAEAQQALHCHGDYFAIG